MLINVILYQEEANYSFAYEVKDAESNNDFGHMETRMGHVAMGSYHVLLPDGRMQKVRSSVANLNS